MTTSRSIGNVWWGETYQSTLFISVQPRTAGIGLTPMPSPMERTISAQSSRLITLPAPGRHPATVRGRSLPVFDVTGGSSIRRVLIGRHTFQVLVTIEGDRLGIRYPVLPSAVVTAGPLAS